MIKKSKINNNDKKNWFHKLHTCLSKLKFNKISIGIEYNFNAIKIAIVYYKDAIFFTKNKSSIISANYYTFNFADKENINSFIKENIFKYLKKFFHKYYCAISTVINLIDVESKYILLEENSKKLLHRKVSLEKKFFINENSEIEYVFDFGLVPLSQDAVNLVCFRIKKSKIDDIELFYKNNLNINFDSVSIKEYALLNFILYKKSLFFDKKFLLGYIALEDQILNLYFIDSGYILNEKISKKISNNITNEDLQEFIHIYLNRNFNSVNSAIIIYYESKYLSFINEFKLFCLDDSSIQDKCKIIFFKMKDSDIAYASALYPILL